MAIVKATYTKRAQVQNPPSGILNTGQATTGKKSPGHCLIVMVFWEGGKHTG